MKAKTRKGLTLLPLVAITMLVFAPFWTSGKLFVPADFLRFIFPWRTDPSPGPIPVHNVELFDVMTLFYPEDVFINAQLKLGHLPIWNPQLFLGYPLCASGQAALWYAPRMLLQYLFSPGVARTLSLMLHLPLAGAFFALWLRDRGFSRPASALAAMAYMLNGQMAAWLEYEHIVDIGAWLGLQLWLIDRACGLPAERTGVALRPSRAWSLLALVWGLSLQAGHLQLCLHYSLVVFFYALFRARHDRRALGWLGLCVSLAGLLSAPTVLPCLELLHRSQRADLDPFTSTASILSLLGGLICPDLFGDPTRGFLFNRCPSNLVFPEFACFVGLVALGCAVLSYRRDPEWFFWMALVVCSLLWASASPPYAFLIKAVPLLRVAIPGRALLMVAPGLAYLAASGLEELREGRRWGQLTLFAAVVAVGWGAAEGYASMLGSMGPNAWDGTWHSWLAARMLKLPPVDLGPAYAQTCFRKAYAGNVQFHLPLALSAAMLACTGVARPRPALAARLLVVLAAVDLTWFIVSFNTVVSPAELDPTPPSIAYLQRNTSQERVEKLGAAYNDSLAPYGLSLLTGYESILAKRNHHVLAVCDGDEKLSMRAPALLRFNHPMLKQMGLRFVLGSAVVPPPGPPWTAVLSGTSSVYERPGALGRAFWCEHPQSVAGFDEALDAISHQTSSDQVWVEGTLPSGKGEAALVSESPDHVVVSYRSDTGGTVVLADSYDPGWVASVNGRATAVVPANGCLRAVAVPPGAGEIRFDYRPRSLEVGFALAALAVLICLGCSVIL